MKKLLVSILLSFMFSFSYCQTFGTIHDNDHPRESQFEMKKGCGHGSQPPCTIPLDDKIVFLIASGIFLAVLYLKKIKHEKSSS